MKNKHCRNKNCGIEINRKKAKYCNQCGTSIRKERKGLTALVSAIVIPGCILTSIYLTNSANVPSRKSPYQKPETNIQTKNQTIEVFIHPLTGQPLEYNDVYQPFVTRSQNVMSPNDFGSERGWEAYLYQEHRKDYFGPCLDLPRRGQFMNITEFEKLRDEFVKGNN